MRSATCLPTLHILLLFIKCRSTGTKTFSQVVQQLNESSFVGGNRYHDNRHLGYRTCALQPLHHRRLDLSSASPLQPRVVRGTPICVRSLSRPNMARRRSALIKHYFGRVRTTDVLGTTHSIAVYTWCLQGDWLGATAIPLLIFTAIRSSIGISLSVNAISRCVEIGWVQLNLQTKRVFDWITRITYCFAYDTIR